MVGSFGGAQALGAKAGEAMKVSIIIPIIRPEKAKRCLGLIEKNAGIPESDYEVITEIDHNRIGCPEMVRKLVARTKYDLVCFLGDDTLPRKDFLKTALGCMESTGKGLIGLNDRSGRILPTHFLAHKRLLPVVGGDFFHCGYYHCFCDNELKDLANEANEYVYCDDAVVDHDHPECDKNFNEWDHDLRVVYENKKFYGDRDLYFERKAARLDRFGIGFPMASRPSDNDFWLSFIGANKPNFILLTPRIEVYEYAHNIAMIRNDLVRQAQWFGVSKLIMMDTDQTYPPDVVDKLLRHKGARVVGAPVHRRYPPYDIIMLRGGVRNYVHVPDEEIYSGDLVEVDCIGTGCIYFDMSIFREIKYPWFSISMFKDDAIDNIRELISTNGIGMAELKEKIKKQVDMACDWRPVGEDVSLCSRIREKGIKIYVDTSIDIEHHTQFRVNRETYQAYKKFSGFKWKNQGDKTINKERNDGRF